VREKILGSLAWLLYRSLMLTWRVQVYEPPEMIEFLQKKQPFLMAHWHGDELALVQLVKRYKVATLSSQSKDGTIMTIVLKKLGATVVRGSSSRGAVSGLLGLMKLIRKGYMSSFAVDGPKGPLHKAKPGILEASKNLKVPIVCVGAACDRAWVFHKAWNKTFLPKPFAKISIIWAQPLPIVDLTADPADPKLLEKVESSIHAAKQQALGIIAGSAS
jgi:lysophospholipid acyltransferase (LPLAT)-like uncharacterized protein